MKYLFFIALLSLNFSACKKDDSNPNNGLLSTWTLKEVLMAPSNSSGTFQEVTSNKTIKFFDNNTLLCEGNLCDLSTETNPSTIGNYSSTDSIISSYACDKDIEYSISGNTMILTYHCAEICKAKYVK